LTGGNPSVLQYSLYKHDIMEDNELFNLIKKYLDGLCTAEEKARIEQWYDQQENNTSNFYNNSPEQLSNSAKRSFTIIKAAIRKSEIGKSAIDQEPIENANKTHIQSSSILLKLYKPLIAAAVIVICGITALYFYPHKNPLTKYNEIIVSAGHVVHLKLADSTLVSLNAGSRLRYPQVFNSKTREIFLEGEAYFDVSHNPEKPFKVYTSGLTTTVLGTAFSVTAYKNSAHQSVAVIRGKVSVADDKETLGLLTPDKRIIYDLETKQGKISSITAATLMSWKSGQLQFENQEMEDIASRLGRWYGYHFKLDDHKMGKNRYTASFNNTISLQNMLEIMKAISKVNYKIDEENKIVTLY